MTGGTFKRRPKGRWSGDIGGGGNPTIHIQPIFRTREPKRDAAMIRQPKHRPTHTQMNENHSPSSKSQESQFRQPATQPADQLNTPQILPLPACPSKFTPYVNFP